MGVSPLADRIRPKTLAQFVGQKHLAGKNGIIRKLIKSGKIPSIIFWGPPGSGKTTLAYIIAKSTNSPFSHFSAVTATLDDVRRVIEQARERLSLYNQHTILFLDEIHRFNKAQQDALLPHVEKGTIILIGATTENPSFEIIPPLLSRCRVFVLERLKEEELNKIVERGLKLLKMEISTKALRFLVKMSNGDARIALNALEIASGLSYQKSGHGLNKKKISLKIIQEVMQKKTLLYDKGGEEHYNTVSAFIKSMRASNVDATLYYLARMVEGGEDPLFIARRMIIFASEDIGVACPTALVIANEVFQACQVVGYPECAINLAHGAVYLAKAPKDRSAYSGLRAAQEDVKKYGNLPIPFSLRNPVSKLTKNFGYGRGYRKYTLKDLLPPKLKGKRYYQDKTPQ